MTLPDETKQYWVDIVPGGTSLQQTVQTPASIELEYLFVRYGLKALTGPVELPANTTIGGVAVDVPSLDTRFVNVTGDTMTGPLSINATGFTSLTLRNGGATDGVQMRFRGNATGVDQWAVGNEVSTGAVGRNFDIYDVVTATNRLRIAGGGGITLTGETEVRSDAETVVGYRAAGNAVIFRARASRGTIAAPTNTTGGDIVRYDLATARTNNAWQDVARTVVTAQAAAGGLAQGDWTLDLTDTTGALQRRVTVLGSGLTTVAGAWRWRQAAG